MSLPFTGIATFAKVPVDAPEVPPAPHAVILGIPYDEGTTNLSGARLGPRAIREASTQYAFYKRGRGYHDLETDRPMLQGVELRDGGDVEIVPTSLEANLTRIGERVRAVAARGAFPVCLGGDHSVTFPIVRALAEGDGEAGAPLWLVQVDAHLDFVDDLHGARHTHASPMRRIAELPGVRGWAQIGARSIVSTAEDLRAARKFWAHVVPGNQVENGPWEVPPPPAPARLYLTFDIDALDPAAAPGTGFPEPGGLTFREAAAVIRRAVSWGTLVGMDVVEVSPLLDPSRRTAVTAARLVLEALAARFDGPAAAG
jgi:agmatinase